MKKVNMLALAGGAMILGTLGMGSASATPASHSITAHHTVTVKATPAKKVVSKPLVKTQPEYYPVKSTMLHTVKVPNTPVPFEKFIPMRAE